MKIKAIEVKNLFSYDDFKIEFNEGNIAVIVGPNNAGKTNLFRVLEFLKDVIDEVMSYMSNTFRKDLIGRKMFMYQNNPEKDSYIALKITLDKKEQKLIDDFLKCCFEDIINEAQLKYIKDVNYDDIQIINEILKCIEEIKEIEDKMKKDLPYLPIEYEEIYDLLVGNNIKITTLLKYLFISYIPRFLSKGVLIWKYEGEYERLNYPKYYTVIETPELNKKDILNKIENLKTHFEQQYRKYESYNYYSYIFKTLKIIELIFCNQLLIKLDENSIVFKKIKNLESFQEVRYFLNNNFPKITPNKLDSDIKDWDITDDIVAFYNPLMSSYISENLKAISNKIQQEYIRDLRSNLYNLFLSIYKNELILMKGAIAYPEKNLKLPKYIDYKVRKEYDIGLSYRPLLKTHELHKIKALEEYKVSPELRTVPTISEYDGNGKDLAKYLFYLKNYHWKRFYEIKETLKLIFKQENIYDLDIFINENKFPEIRIMFKEIRNENKKDKDEDIKMDIKIFPIENVGSGIFEVLNILSVVIGAEEKVILLDEPALHLHPVYQKKLLNILKGEFNLEEDKEITEETKNILKNVKKRLEKNQVIIITHSPYFVNSELLPNTFRFYKDENGKTKVINVYEQLSKCGIDSKDFSRNDALIRSLFANGVILAEGDSEYLSVPILLKKLDCALDDYNIEILNVGSKTGFEKYIKLMNSLRIPCAVVCDGDTVFKNNNGKLTLNYNGNLLKVYKEIKPFWISEIDEILNNLSNSENYEEIDKLLRTKLFIYACKEHDWTDFLINKFKNIEIDGKKLKESIKEKYGENIEKDNNNNVKKIYKVKIKSNDGKEYKIGLWGIDNIPKNIINDFKRYLENSQGKYELIEEEYKPKKKRIDKAGIAYFIAKNVPKEYIDNLIKNENDELAKLKQFIKNFIDKCTNI